MIGRRSPQRLVAACLLVVTVVAPASRGMSEDLTEAALTVSPDAPARLVLNHWPAGGWLVRQTDRQVELVFPGAWLAVSAESIALPAADGAIETLATELDGGATYLRIGLGCDCIVALQGDDSRLLIDVVAAGRNAGPIFRDAGRAPRLAPLPPLRRLETAAAVRPTDGQRVEETRTRLLGELRRAANAGLVTLRPEANGVLETEIEHPPAPDDPIEPENDPTAAETAGSLPEGEVVDIESTELTAIRAAPDAPALAANAEQGGSASPHPPVDVAPPIDRDMAASPAMLIAPSDLVALPAAPACFGNEAFQLTDPLSPAELTAEIARLRSTLVGEFDRVDTPTALSLARLYLAHGLGIEALDILAVFAPDAPETGLLAALSWLAEGKPLPVQNLLSVSGCTGQHALWQALNAALSARPAGAIEHEAAAAGALEQTARGLRGQIAVRLGLAAIAGRDWNAASRLHAMASRDEEVTLRLAATVESVLPNGHLVIRGSQEVRINFELRDLQVSGIVRPEDISRQNVITYDKIADARIVYGGRGQITDMQQPRLGQQIVDLLSPF